MSFRIVDCKSVLIVLLAFSAQCVLKGAASSKDVPVQKQIHKNRLALLARTDAQKSHGSFLGRVGALLPWKKTETDLQLSSMLETIRQKQSKEGVLVATEQRRLPGSVTEREEFREFRLALAKKVPKAVLLNHIKPFLEQSFMFMPQLASKTIYEDASLVSAADIACSPGGRYCLLHEDANDGGNVFVLDTKKIVSAGRFRRTAFNWGRFSPKFLLGWEGKRVAILSPQGDIQIWDVATGALVSTTLGASYLNEDKYIEMSMDRSGLLRVITASTAERKMFGRNHYWDLEAGEKIEVKETSPRKYVESFEKVATGVIAHDNKKALQVVREDGNSHTFVFEEKNIKRVAWSADG
ncbi:MAG TPA: hypothetical protein VGT41_02760 [Candidatus Babeliales bacterium]|nr:hypothetical protein [Candidatus Babeliales bacterium]